MIGKVVKVKPLINGNGGLCLIHNCPELYAWEFLIQLGYIEIDLVVCNQHAKSTFWTNSKSPAALIVAPKP